MVMICPGRRMRAVCAPERWRADSTTDAVLFCPTTNCADWALHTLAGSDPDPAAAEPADGAGVCP